jgi:CubicO group peptidase (beta-lactamase class C family)
MPNINFKFSSFVFLFLILNNHTFAQLSPQIVTQIDKIFKAESPYAPGASVAIIKNGRILFNKGYGLANIDYNIPIDSNSVFDVGSVTKHFTAFSILLLEDKNQLNLDDEVSKYIDISPFNDKHITIRHLLHHTSGIKDYTDLCDLAGVNLNVDVTNEGVLEVLRWQETLNFEPGTSRVYSNTNYLLLAEIVKKVSGMGIDKFCSKFIFTPLGMNHTVFVNENIIKGRVNSYFKSEEGVYKSVLNASSIIGPGGCYSTSSDIAKWLNNLSTGTIGEMKVVNKFLSSTILNDGLYVNTHSCVLAKKMYHDQSLYLSDGGWGGYRSQVFYFPKQQIGIVVLANSAEADVYTPSCRIADMLLEKEPASVDATTKQTIPVKLSSNLSRFEGNYDLGLGFKVSVKKFGNKLKVKSVWDQDYLEMTPVDSNAFMVYNHDDYQNREIRFVYDVNLEDYVFVYNHIDRGYKYEYTHPEKAQLNQFTGSYYSKEIGTVYTIVLKDTQLYISSFAHGEIALTPMQGNVFEFVEQQSELDKVEFIKNDKGIITGFNLKVRWVKNLIFTKI